MHDERMLYVSYAGKFIKQYIIYFTDGAEMHASIYMTDECHLKYHHNFKYPDGRNEFYTAPHERDFFEFPDLDRTVTEYMKSVAMRAKARLRVIEFPVEMSLARQFEAMKDINKDINIDTRLLEKVDKKYEEIKRLEDLWNRGQDDEPNR